MNDICFWDSFIVVFIPVSTNSLFSYIGLEVRGVRDGIDTSDLAVGGAYDVADGQVRREIRARSGVGRIPDGLRDRAGAGLEGSRRDEHRQRAVDGVAAQIARHGRRRREEDGRPARLAVDVGDLEDDAHPILVALAPDHLHLLDVAPRGLGQMGVAALEQAPGAEADPLAVAHGVVVAMARRGGPIDAPGAAGEARRGLARIPDALADAAGQDLDGPDPRVAARILVHQDRGRRGIVRTVQRERDVREVLDHLAVGVEQADAEAAVGRRRLRRRRAGPAAGYAHHPRLRRHQPHNGRTGYSSAWFCPRHSHRAAPEFRHGEASTRYRHWPVRGQTAW